MQAIMKRRDGRARLVAAAEALYRRYGAANVGINAVIEAAGVARMTLYNHFESKEALTAAVYEEMAAETLRLAAVAVAEARTESGRVLAIIDFIAAQMATPEHRGCPFIHACLQEPDASGRVLAVVRAYKIEMRRLIHAALDATRPGREDIADLLMLLLDGAVTEAYIGAVASPLAAARRAATAILKVPA